MAILFYALLVDGLQLAVLTHSRPALLHRFGQTLVYYALVHLSTLHRVILRPSYPRSHHPLRYLLIRLQAWLFIVRHAHACVSWLFASGCGSTGGVLRDVDDGSPLDRFCLGD